MQTSDRPEFETAVGKLCAAYNVPATPERFDAYWTAFQKLGVADFVRMVDRALGEGATAKFPTIGQLWGIRKNVRHEAPDAPAKEEPDTLEMFANRLLIKHIIGRSGLGSAATFKAPHGMTGCHPSAELTECLKAKNALIAEFDAYIREGEELATPFEFVRRWVADLKRIGAVGEVTLIEYREICKEHLAREPFPKTMVGYERAA